jgi:hypothetical protein
MLNGTTGRPIDKFKTNGPVISSPSIGPDQTIYVGSDDGNIYALWDSNRPPTKPIITGPSIGIPGEVYDYMLNANDPDDDEFKFIIDFDDGTTLESDFMTNGEEIMVSYSWSSTGTYNLTVYAQDEHGLDGPVATLSVTMPKNKAVNTPLFLQRLFHRFPSLKIY